jgi:hypothetical protein
MAFLKAIGITAAVLLGLFLLNLMEEHVPDRNAPPQQQPAPAQVQNTSDPRWPSYTETTDPRWPATPSYGSDQNYGPDDDYDPDVEQYEQNRDECTNWYYC